ncbi:MAG: hypothetical protein AB6733_00265 [Clostridiaceae bacterium]
MPDILYNVKKVVITELDPLTGQVKGGAVPINIKTAEEAEIDPVESKGDEKVHRDDDLILAIARTPDLLYGYNIKLKDNTFNPLAASLIEGCSLRYSGQNIVGYDAPMLAQGETKKPFKMDVYVANYEGDNIKNYVKLTFNKCMGRASKAVFKKDFYSPELVIEARENTLASKTCKSVDYVDTLPADDITPPTLTMVSTGTITKPAPVIAKSNELGALYMVSSAATVASVVQLNTLVACGLGAVSSISVTDTNTNITTSALAAGVYKVYAVDISGNISTGSNITLA